MSDNSTERPANTPWAIPPFRMPVSEIGGIFEAIGTLEGRNKVAAAFYDGPGWRRFKLWEGLFLALQGGQRRARMQILGHLPEVRHARVLEIGIGDGANLPLLPAGWEIHGVDLARSRLGECLGQHPSMGRRLARAEAESLPYDDDTFDASYTIGGFNFFGGHEAALREMRRVTRPGGTMIVADEVPWLPRCGIGHLLGVPTLDGYWLRALGLDRDFAAMVIGERLDVRALFGAIWPESVRHSIWHGLGYCMVERGLSNRPGPEGGA